MNSTKIIAEKMCSLSFRWIILFAIGGMLVAACSTPRSVRYAGQSYKINKSSGEKEAEEAYSPEEVTRENAEKIPPERRDITFINEDEVPEILRKIEEEYPEETEKHQEITKRGDQEMPDTEEAKIYDMAARGLPTLREQMQMLGNGQDEMNGKMDRLQSDVDDIKQSLAEIKDVLYAIESSEAPTPIKGPAKSVDANTGDKKINKKKDDFIILSDEQKKREESKKSHKPKPKNEPEQKSESKKIAQKQSGNKSDKDKENSKPAKVEKVSDALEFFKKKDYNKTIVHLEIIIKNENDPATVSECHYWIGESHFGLEDYHKAIEHFRQVIESINAKRKDDAQIMIAESHMRIGQVPKARNAFRQLVAEYPTSEYVPRARKMLQQL
jgi:TolA-binding protein